MASPFGFDHGIRPPKKKKKDPPKKPAPPPKKESSSSGLGRILETVTGVVGAIGSEVQKEAKKYQEAKTAAQQKVVENVYNTPGGKNNAIELLNALGIPAPQSIINKEQQQLTKALNILNSSKSKGGVPSGVPERYRDSIAKWGKYLERELKKNGKEHELHGFSGPEFLAKVIQAESGWDERIGHPDNTSYAGAQGLGQFIPSTRDAFLQFGVDAYSSDPDQQIQAVAYHLDGTHTAGGLDSYNPGFPESADNPYPGQGWKYYLDQDVGSVVPQNTQRIAKARQLVNAAQNRLAKMGVDTPTPQLVSNKTNQRQPKDFIRVPSVVRIGRAAQNRFGLRVGENPEFDTVDPVHVPGSWHYQRDKKGRGTAIDVSGDPQKLREFNEWVAKRWGPGIEEMFHDGGINIKQGQPTGDIGGHDSHVHVAVSDPGARIKAGNYLGTFGASAGSAPSYVSNSSGYVPGGSSPAVATPGAPSIPLTGGSNVDRTSSLFQVSDILDMPTSRIGGYVEEDEDEKEEQTMGDWLEFLDRRRSPSLF